MLNIVKCDTDTYKNIVSLEFFIIFGKSGMYWIKTWVISSRKHVDDVIEKEELKEHKKSKRIYYSSSKDFTAA